MHNSHCSSFFRQSDWLPLPSDWKNNIVVGKTYNTDKKIGKDYWDIVQALILGSIVGIYLSLIFKDNNTLYDHPHN